MASFVFVKWLSGHFSVTGGLAVTTFSLTKSIFFNDIFFNEKMDLSGVASKQKTRTMSAFLGGEGGGVGEGHCTR